MAAAQRGAPAPLCSPAQQHGSRAASRCPASSLSSSSGARRQPCLRSQRPARAAAATTAAEVAPTRSASLSSSSSDPNQRSREGAHEADLVVAQAGKQDPEQPTLASALAPADPADVADVAVVGAGPAGLALAAELAAQGLGVVLVSPESKFVNNYGVWLDEFKELGLEHTLDAGEFVGAGLVLVGGCGES